MSLQNVAIAAKRASSSLARLTSVFGDLAIDLEYARVRRVWRKLPRHERRRISKDYALVRHYRARRNRRVSSR
jgi:hypothetical protein